MNPNVASLRERKSGVIVLGVVGGIGLLFSITGALTSGVSGFLVGLGLTVLVLGLGAVIVGRPGWALIGSRKIGAVMLAIGVVVCFGAAAFLPQPDPKVIEPQALLEPLPSTSQTLSPATSSTSTSTAASSSAPPAIDTAAVAAASSAAQSQRAVAEQAAQAAVAAAKVEADRVAAEAVAAAKAEADRVAGEVAAKAEADRVAAEAAAQAEADRVAAEAAAQAEAGRVAAVQAAERAAQDAAQRESEAAPAPAPSGGSYRNCTEARAAGAAPVYRGEPGYSSKLDRDGDGIGCE